MVRRVNNVFVAWVGRRCFWVNANERRVLLLVRRRGWVSGGNVGLSYRLWRRGLLRRDYLKGRLTYYLVSGVRV